MKKEINIVLKTDIDALKQGFSEGIKATKAAGKTITKEMAEAIAGIEKGFSSIATSKNTARAVKQLQNMAMTMRELGPEFQSVADDMIRRAGGIKDAFGDVGAKIAYFASDTRQFDSIISGLQGVAGAFAVVEGSLAMAGVENEDLQKTLVKLAGAMAVIQGLQEVQNMLQAESAFRIGVTTGAQKAYNIVVGQSVGAMKNFKIALATTGVGALVVGLGLLVAYFDEIKEAITGVTSAQRKMNDVTKDVEDSVRPQIEALKAYSAIVNDTARNESERVTALDELKKAGIETRDIDISTANGLKTLNDRLVENISLMRKKAQSEALNKLLAEESLKYERLKIQYAKRQAQYVGMGTDEATKKRLKSMYAEAYAADESENLLIAKKDLTYIENEYNKVLSEQIVIQTAQNKATKNVEDKIESEKKAIEAKKKATDDYIKSAKDLRDLEAQIQADGLQAKPIRMQKTDDLQSKDLENSEQKKRFDESVKAYEKQQKILKENRDFVEQNNQFITQGESELTDEQAAQQQARIDNMVKELEAKKGVYQAEAELQKDHVQSQLEYEARMTETANRINEMFEQSLENTTVAFGELVGSMANGTAGLEDFTDGVLLIIADFLSSMGKALVAGAIATKAFKELMFSNPLAAAAAGIAAVAASVVVRNYAEQGPKFANGGIVSGPTYGLMGEYPNANRNPEVIAPLDKLKSMLGDTSGGGGYVAETTIKGKDLALVLRRYNEGASRG